MNHPALAHPCPTCKRRRNASCLSASGAIVQPHAPRLEAAGIPVPRRKNTPMGRPRDYAYRVACPTCGSAEKAPCVGRDHGYHKARVLAGEAFRVANGLPEKKRKPRSYALVESTWTPPDTRPYDVLVVTREGETRCYVRPIAKP